MICCQALINMLATSRLSSTKASQSNSLPPPGASLHAGYQFLVAAMVFFSLLSTSAQAIEPVELSDPALLVRYEKLVAELRCLVCQNQSISDSSAPLAKDMRKVIINMLEEQATDEQILKFMTDRYGDFVLLRPRFTWTNAALWIGPFVVLVLAFLVVPRLLSTDRVRLSEQKREQARRLLKQK